MRFGKEPHEPENLPVGCVLRLAAGDVRPMAMSRVAAKKPTLWVIPHTHWEGAVFKTREEYLEVGLPNIVKAMQLLKEQPGYRFTLDQVAYVRPFLERYPGLEPDFRRFLAEGRLQLVGALDVMPDDNMPGGETFIRQMQYGKGYYRDKLGVDVTSAWLIDTFGHHAQLPQLLAEGRFQDVLVRARGAAPRFSLRVFLGGDRRHADLRRSICRIAMRSCMDRPTTRPKFKAFAQSRFDMLSPNSHGPDRVGLSGPDVAEPEEQLAPRVEEFNRDPKAPFAMRMAVPADFEAAIAGRTDRPVWKGELNPIFQGIYSSRIELKAWMRLMEQRLLTAEKLSALAAWLGSPADLDGIWAGWEPVLFNQTHDLASGVMTDHVYEDTIRSYEFAKRRAEAIIDAEVGRAHVQDRYPRARRGRRSCSTRWAGRALISPRSNVGFGEGRRQPASSLTDPDGQTVPVADPRVDPLRRRRPQDRSRRVHRTRCAGAGIFDLSRLARASAAANRGRGTAPARRGLPQVTFENRALSRRSRPRDRGDHQPARQEGRLGSLVRAGQRRRARARPGRPLGALQGPRWRQPGRHDDPAKGAQRGQAAFSDEGKGEPGTVITGPVFSELRVARPFGSGRFATTVRVYAGLRRIEITTRLVNQEKFVRYQALFPTTIAAGQEHARDPFRIDRPARGASSSRRRTGLTTATAGTGWPCSTSACPATSSPTAP